MSELAIGEVARRAGIPATTLRYYEEYGLIAPPPRRSGRRQYPDEILDTLTVVEAARAAGFGLAEIRVLLDAVERGAPGPAWRTLGEIKRPQLNEQVQRLKAMLGVLDAISTCECRSLQECAERLRGGGRHDRVRRNAHTTSRRNARIGRPSEQVRL